MMKIMVLETNYSVPRDYRTRPSLRGVRRPTPPRRTPLFERNSIINYLRAPYRGYNNNNDLWPDGEIYWIPEKWSIYNNTCRIVRKKKKNPEVYALNEKDNEKMKKSNNNRGGPAAADRPLRASETGRNVVLFRPPAHSTRNIISAQPAGNRRKSHKLARVFLTRRPRVVAAVFYFYFFP